MPLDGDRRAGGASTAASVPSSPGLAEVADGVYAYVQPDGSWWVNNAGLVADGDECLLFDTCATAARTDALTAAIHEVTSARVGTVVNSHEHSDHTHGNSRFPGAAIVSHPNAREALARRGIVRRAAGFTPFDVGDLELALPTRTFDDRLSVQVGEHRCELIAAGRPAHTRGDIVLWLPDRGVLFAGDLLMNGVTPLFMSGSVSGTRQVLEETLRPLSATHILPGHGPLGGAELIEAALRYCEFVERVARSALRRGKSPLDAARDADPGEFEGWLDPERLVANLYREMGELSGLAPGERFDYAAAMRDMADLAGTPLLVTRA